MAATNPWEQRELRLVLSRRSMRKIVRKRMAICAHILTSAKVVNLLCILCSRIRTYRELLMIFFHDKQWYRPEPLFAVEEEEEEACCLSATVGLGGSGGRGGEKEDERGEGSCLGFWRGGPRGEGSRTTGFFGRDKSLPRGFSDELAGSASSLRFFDTLALSESSLSEYSESFPSCGGFLRLKEGSGGGAGGMGRGDARSFSLTRGLSSAAWLRSRTRSRSRCVSLHV